MKKTPMSTVAPSVSRPVAALALGLAACAAAHAAEPREAPQPTAVVPVDGPAELDAEDSVTRELIDLLSARGLLSKAEAESLIAKLRVQAAKKLAARAAAPAAPVADAAAVAAAAAAGEAGPATAEAGKRPPVRVVYLPETEKKRLREEVKQEVMEQAKAENWAAPNALPEWTKRITLDGDLRTRYEQDLFDKNNDPFAINFNAINSGSPYDVSSNNRNLPPLANVTQDRSLPRFRLRLGIGVAIADDLRVDVRLATGNNTNPVSTNQTLGTDFNKTTFSVDRAYFTYTPLKTLSLQGGRLPNPFMAPTELVWDSDLNFDGFAARYRLPLGAVEPFLSIGAFSVENTTFDFPSTQSSKVSSRDKWLYAAQLGANWRFDGGSRLGGAVGYYYFDKLQGKLSSPCTPLSAADNCDSDLSRPGFLQKGNTLFALRDLVADPSNPTGPQYQYFGLASSYRELNGSLEFDLVVGSGVHVVLAGDYVRNLGYDRNRVLARVPVNNYGSGGDYAGGQNGYAAQLLVGYPKLEAFAQWNLLGGYRRIETDAVADAFTDSDFHLGGTNAKGYYIGGGFGITRNAWFGARWLSATEVTGAPLAIDVLQVDFNARF